MMHDPSSVAAPRRWLETVRSRSSRIAVRRAVFAALVLVTTALAIRHMRELLAANGTSLIEWFELLLFSVLMVPIALSFWMAACGFLVHLRRGDSLSITRDLAHADDGPLRVRTAIVIPVHNEDPERVSAGVKATYASLARTGHLSHFDFYLLSDTTDPDLWVAEELAYRRLRDQLPEPSRLRYRKRRRNTEHKAGNIAEFCAAHGHQYRYMIVFDADSVMSGGTIVDLVRLMESHPEAGIVQAPPIPVGRQTLFGRVHQFAARAYGPVFMAGMSYLQGGEGNYYGHNAILRIAAFREHCRLPHLPGTGPLSGPILSHDFVEAAFMRRAGYKVHLAWELGGSFEEPPPTLIDFAARDRRWCQGNLQHARLLAAPHLNLISRLHLLFGVLAYVSSPLWILLLVLTTAEAVRQARYGHSYFSGGPSLFPNWQVSTQFEAGVIFCAVMGLLFLPKLLCLGAHLVHPRRLKGFRGAEHLGWSILLESLFSMFLAPVMALLQTRFVIGILRGRVVRWTAQERDDVATPLREACRRHLGLTLLGVAWSVLVLLEAPALAAWLSPVLLGLVLSIPLSWLSSRADLGRKARANGLFVTPEETHPPFVLRTLGEELARVRAEGEADPPVGDGLLRVLKDPQALAIHVDGLPPEEPQDPLAEHARQGLVLKARLKGVAGLLPQERYELLTSPASLRELSLQVHAPIE